MSVPTKHVCCCQKKLPPKCHITLKCWPSDTGSPVVECLFVKIFLFQVLTVSPSEPVQTRATGWATPAARGLCSLWSTPRASETGSWRRRRPSRTLWPRSGTRSSTSTCSSSPSSRQTTGWRTPWGRWSHCLRKCSVGSFGIMWSSRRHTGTTARRPRELGIVHSEASIRVTWPVLTNQRSVFRSRDYGCSLSKEERFFGIFFLLNSKYFRMQARPPITQSFWTSEFNRILRKEYRLRKPLDR